MVWIIIFHFQKVFYQGTYFENQIKNKKNITMPTRVYGTTHLKEIWVAPQKISISINDRRLCLLLSKILKF